MWKNCLEKMRASGFTYGASWSAKFFESELRMSKDTAQFAFEMMALKEAIEKEDGFYLRSSENGLMYDIPTAFGHEDISTRLERGIRRDAVRVINLRSATLANPDATLSQSERCKMEGNLAKAATRLILISRSSAIEKIIRKSSPKLLEK